MLVPGILGFHGVFVASLLVFFLVIRQKWRNALARKAEVEKLIAMAAEESLMEEAGAAYQYGTVRPLYQCAICFSPTTTRCSRCKAVRYCSGKCQILHWRQGHKDRCHPPGILREGSDFLPVAALEKQFENYGSDSEMKGEFVVSSKASSVVDDEVNLQPQANVEGAHTGFLSSNTSVMAGFTSPRVGTELSIGVPPNEVRRPCSIYRDEKPISDAVGPDMPKIRARIKKTEKTMSPSQEATNSVIGVDGTSHASKVDKMKSSDSGEEVNYRSQLSKDKTLMPDDVEPAKLGDKKSIAGAALPRILAKDASNSKSLSSSICSRSDYGTRGSEEDSHHSKGKHVRSLSSSTPRTSSAIGWHSLSNSKSVLPAKVSNIPTLPRSACHGLKTSMQKVVQQFRVSKPLKSYLLGSENEVTGKCTNKTIFPYDLFTKLYSYDEVELRPFGLVNCGNSCYANAVLQCLAFTRPLTSYFLRGLHSKACRKKDWCFICEFEHLVSKAWEGNSPVSPIGILSRIQKIGSHLGHGREEDAHEFLRCAVETMQSVCLTDAGAKGKLAEETTLIGLTFGGYLRSKIKCLKCLGKSERCERMMDLTVEIDGDIGTLEDALAQFTATETLIADNKYRCSRCKSYQKAKKKLTVLEEPNILTIVLKRFQSENFGKLNKSVRFPEVLNMVPYMSETSDGSPIYSLFAVVVHLDVMNAAFSGHYVCYVKNSRGEWFRIDDSTVMPVELERVLLEEAYMLLYARHSPRSPALISNNVVSHAVKSKKKSLEAIPSNCNISKLRSNSYTSSMDSKAQQRLGTSGNQLFDRDEWRFHSMDSSSESSSIFSWSDASSCSTASTKDSSRSEDLTDFIFGDTPGWNKSYGITSDSAASSSYQNFKSDSEVENDAWWNGWREGSGRDGDPAILYANSSKQYRTFSHQYVSNGGGGDIISERVVWASPNDVRLRRASGDNRSAQTFY